MKNVIQYFAECGLELEHRSAGDSSGDITTLSQVSLYVENNELRITTDLIYNPYKIVK